MWLVFLLPVVNRKLKSASHIAHWAARISVLVAPSQRHSLTVRDDRCGASALLDVFVRFPAAW